MSGGADPSQPKPFQPGPIVAFWLRSFFWLASRASFVLYAFRPLVVMVIVLVSPQVRRATARNLSRIEGKPPSLLRRFWFARRVVRSFFEFVIDAARCTRLSVRTLRQRIQSIDGKETYDAVRQEKRGAVLVTAHLGSFEVGLAALTEVEPRVHVVFKRDSFSEWERMRCDLRKKVGVIEAPIDDGFATLMNLKAALENDEVIVMQADRAWPGQQSCVVPVLHGHLRLPTGPVKMAMLNDSPIVPVLAVRSGPARFRIVLGDAIRVRDYATTQDAVAAVGRALGRFIAAVPTQWLVLQPAFVEDQPA